MESITPPRSEPARKQWIRYQLALRGLSMAAVSRQLRLSRSMAGKVFVRRYPRVEEAIAKILGMAPEAIWPERYVDGSPIKLPPGPRPKSGCVRHVASNTTAARKGSQSRESASADRRGQR